MHESAIITNADGDQLAARRELFDLMQTYPATREELERSLGLFVRGSLLARILATFEIYQKIVPLPGAILDLGTWRGQTAVLCENFRAILEPLNFQRRIHAFDTFTGYTGFAEHDTRDRKLFSDGTYSLSGEYADLLRKLLNLHERSNAMGHVHDKHHVWEGDCRDTLAAFDEAHPGEMVALAWFDLNVIESTRHAFDAVMERLVPGGVVAFWQLTRGGQLPAEGIHYLRDLLGNRHGREQKHTRIREVLDLHPDLSFVLLGDSGEHDPQVYADIVREYPGRILAVYIREVRLDPGDGRVEKVSETWDSDVPFVLAADSDAVRRHAQGTGLLPAP